MQGQKNVFKNFISAFIHANIRSETAEPTWMRFTLLHCGHLPVTFVVYFIPVGSYLINKMKSQSMGVSIKFYAITAQWRNCMTWFWQEKGVRVREEGRECHGVLFTRESHEMQIIPRNANIKFYACSHWLPIGETNRLDFCHGNGRRM